MGLLDRYLQQATVIDKRRLKRMRILGEFRHPYMDELTQGHAEEVEELMDLERREWATRTGRIRSSGVPTAAAGFASPLIPNSEPVNSPVAVASSGEINMYTPATTANADWALIPQGAIHAPQSLFVAATGTYTNNSTGNTIAFGTRIGTSSTAANNVSVGVTGTIGLGSSLTAALWFYEAQATVTAVGTSGTIQGVENVSVAQQVTSASTTLNGLGGTSGTVDWTQQQGWVLTMKGNATGITSGVVQFLIAAWD